MFFPDAEKLAFSLKRRCLDMEKAFESTDLIQCQHIKLPCTLVQRESSPNISSIGMNTSICTKFIHKSTKSVQMYTLCTYNSDIDF